MLRAVQRAADRQCLADRGLGVLVAPLPRQHVSEQHQRLRDFGRALALRDALHLERGAQARLGLRVLALEHQHLAEVPEAARYLRVALTQQPAPLLVRRPQQPRGWVVQAEARVHRAHGVHERRLDRGLVGEFGLDPARALVEDLARGDGVAERLGRIRHLEEVHHEARGLSRGLRLRLGAHSLGLGADALPLRLVSRQPRGRRERRGHRHAGERGRHEQHGAAVPALRLALLEFVERDADQARDQLQLGVVTTVFARTDVRRDRFRALAGEYAVRAHLVDKCVWEALLLRHIGLRRAAWLAGDDQTDDAVRAAKALERQYLLVDPARARGRRRADDDQRRRLRERAGERLAEVSRRGEFLAVAEHRCDALRHGAEGRLAANEMARQSVGLERAVQPLRPALVGVAVANKGPVAEHGAHSMLFNWG